ncbi:hypothetical protein AB2M62_06890 [Sphingomonas sp. MMS12-HWE2-04]|uniref:hypothetical protein n=1 Tax=Sphingomonas sp. MMS12-HWE2-04 TaxID=3234199 RepID=UPI00384F99E2
MSIRFAILIALLGLAAPAGAQDMPTVMPNDYVLKDILNQQRIDAAIARPRRPATRAAPPAVRAAPMAATRYRASPVVSSGSSSAG